MHVQYCFLTSFGSTKKPDKNPCSLTLGLNSSVRGTTRYDTFRIFLFCSATSSL